MPMMRATFEFRDIRGFGWSETWFNTLTTYADVMDEAEDYLTKRVALLGGGAELTYIRVSDDFIKRDAIVKAFSDDNSKGRAVVNGESDIANTALNLRIQSSPTGRRILYMRGIPDQLIQNSGQVVLFPAWTRALNGFGLELVRKHWAIRIRDFASPGVAIININQDPVTGLVTVTTAGPHGIALGTPYVIRGVTGPSFLNGEGTPFSVPSPTSITVKTAQIMPPWLGGGTCGPLAFTLARVATIDLVRATHRITGRPFDSPRGRRSVR